MSRDPVLPDASSAAAPRADAEFPVLFDAVVFDLDGTLVATDRFWVAAARAGAKRAFAELGLERELPDARAWMSMVGLPAERAFALVFPDLDERARAVIRRACGEEEQRALRSGGAALMPGAAELCAGLAAAGVRLGIASNCGRDYLEAMVGGLALERWIDAPRCLDSPGISSKADMVADVLDAFGTRSAVMVGDRRVDRDAAWENGLPHVHLESGFGAADEGFACEARVADLAELGDRLRDRARWLDAILAALEVGPDVRTLGVGGGPAAGKTLFARDLAQRVRASGRPVRVVAVADYALPGTEPASGRNADPTPEAYDLQGLARALDEARAAGKAGGVRVEAAAAEAAAAGAPARPVSTLPELVIVEGPALVGPAMCERLDRLLWLAVGEETVLRRVAGRDARRTGPAALVDLRRRILPAWRALEERRPPAHLADLVVDADSPLGPPKLSSFDDLMPR